MQTGQDEAACALWSLLLMFSTGVSSVWSINHPSCLQCPFSPCVFCSSGVWQRHATVPERRHMPPPPAVPLSPRLHRHPVREGSLPGVRGVRWSAIRTSLLQSARRRPLAYWSPRGDAAVDCFPSLKGHGWPSILNQKTHKITFTETEPLDLEDTKDKGCRDDMLKVH